MTERCRGTDSHSVVEEGVRLERDGASRVLWVIGTCRRCGRRLQKPYHLRERGEWRHVPIDQRRETA